MAISCSWCKQAVSILGKVSSDIDHLIEWYFIKGLIKGLVMLFSLQYHNKLSCFMLQQIEEPCPIGAHAALVVPPTWIIRIRRHQVTVHFNKTTYCVKLHNIFPIFNQTNTPSVCLPQSSMKSSKKKKRTSFKRKNSKKGAEVSSSIVWFWINSSSIPILKYYQIFIWYIDVLQFW